MVQNIVAFLSEQKSSCLQFAERFIDAMSRIGLDELSIKSWDEY